MRWIALAFVVLGGCFDEPAPSSGTGGATDSGGCAPGALGCACAASSACDEGLVCEPSVTVCIEEDCTPGTALCTCSSGACLSGLSCDAGVCRPPPPDGTTGSMSSTEDSGPPPQTSDGTLTTAMTTDTTVAPGDVDDSAGDPCGACASCIDDAIAGPCAGQFAACDADGTCLRLLSDTRACCDQDCVNGACQVQNGRTIAYPALATCLDEECVPVCRFSFGC